MKFSANRPLFLISQNRTETISLFTSLPAPYLPFESEYEVIQKDFEFLRQVTAKQSPDHKIPTRSAVQAAWPAGNS